MNKLEKITALIDLLQEEELLELKEIVERKTLGV
jgi:hypothetical protein